MRQYYERLIGPRRLSSHPVLKNPDVIPVERLFCHQGNFDNAVEVCYQALRIFADDGTETCAINQPGDSLGVAPNGRKYQNNPSGFVSPGHRILDP
jgi:hypothetical protein